MLRSPKNALFAIAGVLSLAMASPTLAKDITLKVGTPFSGEQQGGKLLEAFAEEVNAADVGLDVKVFLASVLGSGEELMEDTIRGNVDMTWAYVYANRDPVFEINSLPYLVSTDEEMRETFGNMDSAFSQIMGDTMAKYGLKLLANSAEGFVGVITTKRPNDPTGVGDKGVNIRVWNSAIGKLATETLGYRTTTMNFSEVFAAIQSGTVDGAICCTAVGTYDVFTTSQVGKFFTPLHAFAESSSIYMNSDKWDELTPEQQSVVQTATTKAANGLMEWALENEASYVEKIREAGWEVLELTDEEHAAQATRIQEVVWPQLADRIGQENLDRLQGN
ncbi:MAG: TRAP transporter substrate-binding protein DctP [Rhodobacteraceae bacterium]|jgi:TRAP-type transport system periplasmic protein|nr:TRAP transporter substrate-binding protein DctP [Paracoccaceae bacterium]